MRKVLVEIEGTFKTNYCFETEYSDIEIIDHAYELLKDDLDKLNIDFDVTLETCEEIDEIL